MARKIKPFISMSSAAHNNPHEETEAQSRKDLTWSLPWPGWAHWVEFLESHRSQGTGTVCH